MSLHRVARHRHRRNICTGGTISISTCLASSSPTDAYQSSSHARSLNMTRHTSIENVEKLDSLSVSAARLDSERVV